MPETITDLSQLDTPWRFVDRAKVAANAAHAATRLRILPNHACATGAQHEGYNLVEGKREVLARWKRFSGW